MEGLDHSHRSTFREMLLRHLFIGEVLKILWRQGRHAEVLGPYADDSGYDVAIECDGILRHIQLKASQATSKTNRQTISLKLASKPSGCVVWLVFDDQIRFTHFLWLGGGPGLKLPELGTRVAKHTKGNSLGQKLERPGLRVVPIQRFSKIETIDDLVARLFGRRA